MVQLFSSLSQLPLFWVVSLGHLLLTHGIHVDNEDEIIDKHSYVDRLKKSKSEVLIGLFLCILLPFFLWYTEQQVVKYQQLISRCQLATIEVKDPYQIRSCYQNRPVLVKGLTSIDETAGILRDTELGYQLDYHIVRLKRIVEMYQWIEHVREDEDQTVYRDEKGWLECDCDSNSFRDSSHHNPARHPNIYSITKNAEAVYVGAYHLSQEQVNKLHDWKSCPIPAIPSLTYSNYHHLFPRIERSSTIMPPALGSKTPDTTSLLPNTTNNGYIDYLLFNGGTLHSPNIGTVRVSYECVYASSPITTVGVQIHNTFRPYTSTDSTNNTFSICSTTNGYDSIDDDYSSSCCCGFDIFYFLSKFLSREIIGSEILLVEERLTDIKSIFRDEKRSLLWRLYLVRLIAYLLLSLGIYLILKPIATLLSFIPLVGSVIATTLWIASLLLGFVTGILITSCAWVAYRPSILTGVLLTIGGALWITADASHSDNLLAAKVFCGLSIIPFVLSLIASFDECQYRRYLSSLASADRLDEHSNRERDGLLSSN